MLIERLKDLRIQKKLSQADVARHLCISRQAYNFYETGKREPDNETVIMLADLFDVSVDYLFGRNNDQLSTNTVYLNSSQYQYSDSMIEKVVLSEKDMRDVKRRAEGIKGAMMNAVGIAFDGKPQDEETLEAVLAALEEGLTLAKKEAKIKYTPKKYRK